MTVSPKFSHKVTIKYQFAHGGCSNVMKLARSEAEARTKEAAAIAELKQLGHAIISAEVRQIGA